MSEESNVVISPTEKDEYPESENGPNEEEHNPKPALHSDESSSGESLDVPAEHENVQENNQPIEPAANEQQNRPLDLPTPERNVESADSSPFEKQLTPSDAPTETKSLETANDIDQPAIKPIEISPSLAPSSDKALKEVTENIQLIYDGLKDMKLSEQEVAGSASGKKGRKPAATPRARSTPIKLLTSPPLTRSRSRDLLKFSSTPASPGRSAAKKGSDSDSDEIKGVRGRQREKRN